MAGETVDRTGTDHRLSSNYETRLQLNKLIDDVELMRSTLASLVPPQPLFSGVLGPTGLAMGDPNTFISHGAFDYQIDAEPGSLEDVLHKDADLVGMPPADGKIPPNMWGAYLLSIDGTGAVWVTGAADNATSGYVDEAAALAALPAVPASQANMGHVTVWADLANGFEPGVDALFGGVGGNPAVATNFYDAGGPTVLRRNVNFKSGEAFVAARIAVNGEVYE